MEGQVTGIKALLSLTNTLLEIAKPDDPNSLIRSVGQASGVLAYLQNEIIGVERSNPIFSQALMEGSEMAVVFAQNFDLQMPGVIWISLHEDNPEKGGEPLLKGREKALIVDVHGDGEQVNIATIEFTLPLGGVAGNLNFLGMWGSEDGDDLIEAAELKDPLSLENRDHLALSPGGLRVTRS